MPYEETRLTDFLDADDGGDGSGETDAVVATSGDAGQGAAADAVDDRVAAKSDDQTAAKNDDQTAAKNDAGATAPTDQEETAADGQEETAGEQPDDAPVAPTATWNPEGAPCDRCGSVVQRRWRDGRESVCVDCVEW